MSGSRGRPRMRSPIWLRLISDVPPVLEVLGLAEVEHNARNNRMRAI